jgi:hypothetical protein
VSKARAQELFISLLGGTPYSVQDKTRRRYVLYVLYRAEPDTELLKLVCRLVPHHPEHADAFFCVPRPLHSSVIDSESRFETK